MIFFVISYFCILMLIGSLVGVCCCCRPHGAALISTDSFHILEERHPKLE